MLNRFVSSIFCFGCGLTIGAIDRKNQTLLIYFKDYKDLFNQTSVFAYKSIDFIKRNIKDKE